MSDWDDRGNPFDQEKRAEKLARASWGRCRTLAQRKDGSTWESISPEERLAWLNGAAADLREAGLL